MRGVKKKKKSIYAKPAVNDDGLVVINASSPADAGEGQGGAAFIPLAFALQGEPLIVE